MATSTSNKEDKLDIVVNINDDVKPLWVKRTTNKQPYIGASVKQENTIIATVQSLTDDDFEKVVQKYDFYDQDMKKIEVKNDKCAFLILKVSNDSDIKGEISSFSNYPAILDQYVLVVVADIIMIRKEFVEKFMMIKPQLEKIKVSYVVFREHLPVVKLESAIKELRYCHPDVYQEMTEYEDFYSRATTLQLFHYYVDNK